MKTASRTALLLGSCTLVFSAVAEAVPVLADDFYTPDALVYTVSAPGVLANDSSTAGGLQVVSLNITGLQGSITGFPDGRFVFTPQTGLASNTSLTYTAQDASGARATATMTFDMVSTLPRASADAYTPHTTVFSVAAPNGLLANDTGGIGGLRTVAVNATNLRGSVTGFPDGHFTFTPTAGLAVDTSFTYTVADGLGRTSTGVATFDMTSTLPTAVTDRYTPTASLLSVDVVHGLLANDRGGIGALRAVSVDVTGTRGSIIAFPDGHFTFAPTYGSRTDTSFRYTMSDELNRTSTADVLIDMESTLPIAVLDAYTIATNQVLDVAAAGLLANDFNGIGRLSLLDLDVTGLAGSVTGYPDGRFRFAPLAGFVGTTHFAYDVVDELGRTSRATVDLLVTAASSGQVPEPETLGLILLSLVPLWRLRKARRR